MITLLAVILSSQLLLHLISLLVLLSWFTFGRLSLHGFKQRLAIATNSHDRFDLLDEFKTEMMTIDPRTVIISKNLLDFIGEARAIIWKVLPLNDDGINLILYCPTIGDYGTKTAEIFGRELERKIEFIPVASEILMQAINEQFATIKKCPIQFSFLCPKTWQSLELTDTEAIRFCPTCRTNVYWCETPAEVHSHERTGECIAVLSSTYSRSLPSLPSLPSRELYLGRR